MTVNVKDPAYIKELAQIMDDHGLTKISIITTRETDVILEKSPVQTATSATITEPLPAAPVALTTPQAAPTTAAEKQPTTPPQPNANDITSPMVGVFYSSSSPDAAPFVRIGDSVKKGDVICILEAMKLMNEVTAEKAGKIIDICAQSGDVVEFGQVLFKLENN